MSKNFRIRWIDRCRLGKDTKIQHVQWGIQTYNSWMVKNWIVWVGRDFQDRSMPSVLWINTWGFPMRCIRKNLCWESMMDHSPGPMTKRDYFPQASRKLSNVKLWFRDATKIRRTGSGSWEISAGAMASAISRFSVDSSNHSGFPATSSVQLPGAPSLLRIFAGSRKNR